MKNKVALDVVPIILCGGSGERLWPLSRKNFPKQFISFGSDRSLFQHTVERFQKLSSDILSIRQPLIVTNVQQQFIVEEQLLQMAAGVSNMVLEPVSKNTAPALTFAAMACTKDGEDPILVVSPSDHLIADQLSFGDAIAQGVTRATEDHLVVFGVQPDSPQTGYGYIKCPSKDAFIQAVERFVEKPNLDIAQEFLADGNYYWNSGIFVIKASVWLRYIKIFREDIYNASLTAFENSFFEGNYIKPREIDFSLIPSESIDRAVVEKCCDRGFRVDMIRLESGWSDLGVWDSVWQSKRLDDSSNVWFGDVLEMNSSGNLAFSSGRLLTLVGVTNLIVVETPDAVLVANRSNSQEIRQVVAKVKEFDRQEYLQHRRVHRPWGWFDNIEEGVGFKVKRIRVNPGASLSLQKHKHRSEHWVITSGEAKVIRGDDEIYLSHNESIFIPAGMLHRLQNTGLEAVELIEVQLGEYLGEDDIERYIDQYGRV